MSFKIHLIIVCSIIVALYFAWQITQRQKIEQDTVKKEEVVSPYKIFIISASYGLNCNDTYVDDSRTVKDPFANKAETSKIKRDNVLEIVSKACNDKLKCSIPLVPEFFGFDPMPECLGKRLDVEYRCFSFDRPWQVNGDRKSLDIDCSTAESRATQ